MIAEQKLARAIKALGSFNKTLSKKKKYLVKEAQFLT